MSFSASKGLEAGKVLVIIPAYNEEKTIGDVVRGVRKLHPQFQVLVMNDGSDDRTRNEAESAGASVISLPFNTRGTAAMLAAYLVALEGSYDYVAKIDGDGQHKPDDIVRVLAPLYNGEADIIVGSRYLIDKHESDSVTKIVGRVFSSFIVDKLSGNIGISDVTSGFRAWNSKALRVIVDTYLHKRPLPNTSVTWIVETMIATRKGLRIEEIPVEVMPRVCGRSKSFSLIRLIAYPIRLILELIQEVFLRREHGP